jgi:branched-chain amino acid transport system substrate-binding protein
LAAAVLHEDGPFGTELGQFVPEAAKKAGGPQILAVNGYNVAETKNFTPLILRYQGQKPDVVYWAAYTSDSILFRRQGIERGYTPPCAIAFTSGPGTPDYHAALGNEGSNGVLVLDVPLNINPSGLAGDAATLKARFDQAYKSAYPDQPLTGNAYVGFVGGWIVLKHVLPMASELTPAGIQAAFQKVDVPEGALPTGWGVRFDERGQNTRAFPIALEWQDGRLVPVWPARIATGQPKYVPLPGSR